MTQADSSRLPEADSSIESLLASARSGSPQEPDALDLYVALLERWDASVAPLLAQGGRTQAGVLARVRQPSDVDAAQIEILRGSSAADLVARGREEARFIGSPVATSRHLALAAVALVGQPGLSDLRHKVLDLEEAEARRGAGAGRPPLDWFATGRRRQRVVSVHREERGALVVTIKAVEIRTTRTIVTWRIADSSAGAPRVADITLSDEIGTLYGALVPGSGWARVGRRVDTFGETLFLPAVPADARCVRLAVIGTRPDGRAGRFPGARTTFTSPVTAQIDLPPAP